MLFLCGYRACVALAVGLFGCCGWLALLLIVLSAFMHWLLGFCLRVSCYVACLVLFCVDLLIVGTGSAMRGSLCYG